MSEIKYQQWQYELLIERYKTATSFFLLLPWHVYSIRLVFIIFAREGPWSETSKLFLDSLNYFWEWNVWCRFEFKLFKKIERTTEPKVYETDPCVSIYRGVKIIARACRENNIWWNCQVIDSLTFDFPIPQLCFRITELARSSFSFYIG